MNILAGLLIIIPALTAFFSFFVRSSLLVSIFNTVSSSALLGLGLYFSSSLFNSEHVVNSSDIFIYDSLSAFSVRLVCIISFLVILYSMSYLNSMKKQDSIDDKVCHDYYVYINLFIASMLALALMNNIAWSWIAVESTTLTSALLLGLYRKAKYLEAAWKYIIICTVGILTALFGIVLFVTSITNISSGDIFSFSSLMHGGFTYNHDLIKIAFALIFVGYGTKVGLVPMHSWLPDAYQNAPSPVSALLTSSLSSLILIPILRFKHIVDICFGDSLYTSGFFYFFGFLSIVAAAIFMVHQYDFKRLLAFSSIENLGLIVLAFGLGTKIAMTAAFLHIIFHALVKTVLFFSTGNLFIHYHSHNIDKVRKVFKNLPLTGLALMLGAFACIGLPPFAIFTSKFMIIRELIDSNLILSIFVLFAFAIIFGSFIHYFNKVLFLPANEDDLFVKKDISMPIFNFIAIVIPLSVLLYLGLFIPHVLLGYIEKIVGALVIN